MDSGWNCIPGMLYFWCIIECFRGSIVVANKDFYNSEKDVPHLCSWRARTKITGSELIFPASLRREDSPLWETLIGRIPRCGILNNGVITIPKVKQLTIRCFIFG